ncbi:IclR family transcriptional regulator domain-containing protein [Hydrogenophaga intermedia]|nr:IclR family transcriptional regulator C-terminal domain-containing protein [Hydrogenophaga intermedia]
METHADPDGRDQVAGLAKGLRLVEAFDTAHTRMTLSEAARRTGLSPAAARRCLLTLLKMGYVCSDGKRFWIGPGALRFAYAYTASDRLARGLQPVLDALCERSQETAALCVLDGGAVVIAARSSARRNMRVGNAVGSRLPLHCSAAGRALMADLPTERWRSLLGEQPMRAYTLRTVVSVDAMATVIAQCQALDYGFSDEEIEPGVRSVAVPIRAPDGRTVASVGLSARSERMGLSELVQRFLPSLRLAQSRALDLL